jgi:hypothetical protein
MLGAAELNEAALGMSLGLGIADETPGGAEVAGLFASMLGGYALPRAWS